jgi:hypothetical protein
MRSRGTGALVLHVLVIRSGQLGDGTRTLQSLLGNALWREGSEATGHATWIYGHVSAHEWPPMLSGAATSKPERSGPEGSGAPLTGPAVVAVTHGWLLEVRIDRWH